MPPNGELMRTEERALKWVEDWGGDGMRVLLGPGSSDRQVEDGACRSQHSSPEGWTSLSYLVSTCLE